MSHSAAEPQRLVAPEDPAASRFSWPLALTTAGLLCLWLEVIYQLRAEWSLNPQYNYGWTVPFLAGFVFFRRWLHRPPAAPAAAPRLTIALAVIAGFCFLPLRVVAVANPDWRLLDWAIALSAVVISLCAIQLAGGTPWLRYLAFPVLFFLTAVPWPVRLEQFVIQNLMRADSAITVGLLNFFGTLALQHGNVIELSSGQVGIDDACTGIRSLQATFMVALFLGEFYRLRIARRLLLILVGAAVAFICNIGRTFLLCEVAASSGIDAIHRWHDPAGFTILFICLFALWGLTLWLQTAPDSESRSSSDNSVRASFRSIAWPAALVLWLALVEVSTAAWYARSSQSATAARWTVRWPANELDYRPEAVPQPAVELLRYNRGGAATWRSPEGESWVMYSFVWLPGRTAALFVKNHRPDICLPASGLTMREDNGIHLARVNGIPLPIHSYRFEQNGQPLHVFYCYWDGRSSYENEAAAVSEDWSAEGRLRCAWQGRREVGARMLELIVSGYTDDSDARVALHGMLAKVVRPE